MPWKIDGTVQRENPDFNTGTDIWGQDRQAGIKIIDFRHDFHDQDLADAIADTLNLDGYNAMRANLDMGSWKITNIGVATTLTDVPLYSQIAGSMDWEFDTANQLRMLDRNGDVIDVVTIPTTGGAGGISELTGIDGIVCTPNPITLTGTVGQEDLHTVTQTVGNGISTIEYDKYGRVLSVVGNAGSGSGDPDQSLSITRFSSSVDVNISLDGGGEQSANILAALPSGSGNRAGVMTAGMAQTLEDIEANYVTTDTDQTISAEKRFTGGGDTVLGVDGLPGVFFQGILVENNGNVFMNNLPTSDPGVTGQVWNDGGTLKVSV